MVSHGMPGEVLIISDAASESAMQLFLDSGIGGPQAGLKPLEPRFRCAYLKAGDAKGDALGASLVLLVKKSGVVDNALNELWESAAERAENKGNLLLAEDVWAKGQFVVLAEAGDKEQIRRLAAKDGPLATLLAEAEQRNGLIGGLQPNAYSDSVMQRVAGDFGVTFPLPPQFRLVQANKEMLWFLWEGREFRANLWVNIVSDTIHAHSTEAMMQIRDSFARRYIKGQQGMPMMTSKSSEYETFDAKTPQGVQAWRGWWTISGQWQRGPYCRYFFPDSAGQRGIWLEGFLEAPEIPNLPYYRMFDLIAAGFKFTSGNNGLLP